MKPIVFFIKIIWHVSYLNEVTIEVIDPAMIGTTKFSDCARLFKANK